MASRQEQESLTFLRILKQNLPNFKSLLEAFSDFRNGNTDTAALVSKASELLHGRRDLIVGFNNFLPENHKLPVPGADEPTENFTVDIPTTSQPQLPLKRQRQILNETVEFVNKVWKISNNDEVYALFLRTVTDFEAHRDIFRVDKEISALFKHNRELYIDFTWFDADDNNCRQNQDLPVSSTTKTARKLTKLEKCEDELYESDMRFHSLESTKEVTEKLLKGTRENGNGDDGIIKVEDYYSALNLKCIKKIYGKEDGDEMMEFLQTNPTAAASILLRRLNLKLEKARKLREEVNKKKLRNCHLETQRSKEHNQP